MKTNKYRSIIRMFIMSVTLVYVLSCDDSKDYRACLQTEKTVYYENEEIVFDNCSYYPKGIANATVEWSMGDGTAYKDIGFKSLTHKYELYGSYDVTLSVCPKGPCNTVHHTTITLSIIENTNE